MSQKLLPFIFIVLQIVSLVSSSNVYWKSVTLSQAVLSSPEPGGLLHGQDIIYVCRVHVDGRWISGSLTFSNTTLSSCKVPIHGEEHDGVNFQILISPPGATSWIQYTDNLLDRAIESGNHRDGSKGYVCRVPIDKSLVLGISNSNGNRCYFTLDGKEVWHDDSAKVDLLLVNTYGKFLDEYFPRL